MKDVEYVYAVSYIKTLENKMLTHSDIQTLISAKSIDEAKRFLRERSWSGESAEELLKNELESAWKKAYEVCPDEAPSKGFIVRHGRVYVNCTIEAIFREKESELYDIAAK